MVNEWTITTLNDSGRMTPVPEVYDDALKSLTGTALEYGDGASNLGPVVADALIAMHRAPAVLPWVQGYRHSLEEPPPLLRTITRSNWQADVGDKLRSGDWVAFFRRELSQAAWPLVLNDWLPRLAPGLSGAGGQGLIRTAYALHQLAADETPARVLELAEGLGYWASSYMKLPGILGSMTTGTLAPAEALSRIKWQHKGQPPRFKVIGDGLRGLKGFPSFTGVINLVTIPAEPEVLISRTTEVFARVILAHGHEPDCLLPFIQAVTVSSALRYIIPHLERDPILAFLRYGWQFAGAMYTIYGQANPVSDFDPPNDNLDSLIDRAIATRNEHAIIFTEVCLREYLQLPKPVYLAAAWHAVERLAPPDQDDAE